MNQYLNRIEFAVEEKMCGIPIRLRSAYIRGAVDDNPYNRKTREILTTCVVCRFHRMVMFLVGMCTSAILWKL